MTPKEAAKKIGCCTPHIYFLIKKKKIKAKSIHFGDRRFYDLTPKEVKRFLSIEQTVGFPRGQSRKQEATTVVPESKKKTKKDSKKEKSNDD